MSHRPIVLCIMDGYGLRESTKGNAIIEAKKPNLDALMASYPNISIEASGEAVGLPEGQMGNSEVGHLTIGAGRIIEQDLLHIDNEIKRGDFSRCELLSRQLLSRPIEYILTNSSLVMLCVLKRRCIFTARPKKSCTISITTKIFFASPMRLSKN